MNLLVDNFETGEFKLHRSVFTDQALFDLEMKYIFEGNWVYLAHESQIPNNNDALHDVYWPSAYSDCT